MQKILGLVFLVLISAGVAAQELFVSTEPASNMAAGSIGLRLNTELFKMDQSALYRYRLAPEIMLGINKNLMLHLNMYASDMYQANLKAEGASAYAKYRFFSNDGVQTHLRMAVFSEVSLINNPAYLQTGNLVYSSDEINLNGNNSGILAGLVVTALVKKLAFSSSLAYVNRWDNLDAAKLPGQPSEAVNYTISSGYLLWPRQYKNFRETNINLYVEFLGSSSVDKRSYYLDAAPAIQFIFNSISRLDFCFRTQLTGNMERLSENELLVRFEYNLLNVFKNK